MLSRSTLSVSCAALAFGLSWASAGSAQPGPPDAPPPPEEAKPAGETKPDEKPPLLGAEGEVDDEVGRSPEVHDPFAEADEPPTKRPTPVAGDADHDEMFVPPPRHPPPPPPPEKRSISAYSLMLFGEAVMASLDEFGLHSAIGVDDPDPLVDKDLRLDGDGSLLGAGFRGTIQHDEGWRLALGGSFASLQGVDLLHKPLRNGVRVAVGDIVAVGIETSLGKGFDLDPIYPYLDLRTVVHVVSAQIGLDTDEYGFVGATPYNVVSFTLAPRLGAFVPIDDVFFLDVAGQYGMFGIERAGLFVGFGVWTGDAGH